MREHATCKAVQHPVKTAPQTEENRGCRRQQAKPRAATTGFMSVLGTTGQFNVCGAVNQRAFVDKQRGGGLNRSVIMERKNFQPR